VNPRIFEPWLKIKGKLPKHGIDDIFNDGNKSSLFSFIMKMAEAEVLLNDITVLLWVVNEKN